MAINIPQNIPSYFTHTHPTILHFQKNLCKFSLLSVFECTIMAATWPWTLKMVAVHGHCDYSKETDRNLTVPDKWMRLMFSWVCLSTGWPWWQHSSYFQSHFISTLKKEGFQRTQTQKNDGVQRVSSIVIYVWFIIYFDHTLGVCVCLWEMDQTNCVEFVIQIQ